jgi:hypothetical protein
LTAGVVGTALFVSSGSNAHAVALTMPIASAVIVLCLALT